MIQLDDLLVLKQHDFVDHDGFLLTRIECIPIICMAIDPFTFEHVPSDGIFDGWEGLDVPCL